ncbi:MAG: hypothetical protein ACRY3E_03950 [Candidatus Lariskella arthropodorum]
MIYYFCGSPDYISVLIDGKKYELKNLKLINFHIENKFLYNNSINAYQSTSIQSSESKNFCVTFGGIFAKYTSELEKIVKIASSNSGYDTTIAIKDFKSINGIFFIKKYEFSALETSFNAFKMTLESSKFQFL